MLLLLHIIVAYIKENIITNCKHYAAHPETLGQATNCCVICEKTSLHGWKLYIERPGYVT